MVNSNGQEPPAKNPPMEEVWAFVMQDPDLGEGVPVMQMAPGVAGPMLALNPDQLEVMKDRARLAAAEARVEITLLRFSNREEVERFGPPPPEEPEVLEVVTCGGRCGRKLFGELAARGFCMACKPAGDE